MPNECGGEPEFDSVEEAQLTVPGFPGAGLFEFYAAIGMASS
jgi:hypothetical protein